MKKLAVVIGLPWLLSIGCSKLVGITDTLVTAGDGGMETASSGAGAGAGAGGSASQVNGGGAGQVNGGSAGQVNGGSAGQVNGGSAGQVNGGSAGAGANSNSQAGTSSAGTSAGGTPAGGSSSAGANAGGQGGSAGAPVLRGPKMIDVGGYSVDSTEVTVANYKAFLKAKAGDTSGQPAVCSWNKSYYDVAMPVENDTWPIAKVDWCDANAYCSWAGKRLCGAIGGGPADFVDFLNAAKSQWFRACGGSAGQSHPNTNAMCNNKGGFTDTAPVSSFPGCEGFFPGLFDLQGNVAEWVDACDGTSGQGDHCILAGGSEIDQLAYCTESFKDVTRGESARTFGFRCCSK